MHYPFMQTTHYLHKTILALAIYIFPRRKISLSLLIKMAHNLHIGQKFEDFAAFESAIMRYQNAENVQFYSRVSRSDDKAQPRLNPKIKYYEVKYHCINGVKKRISKATGAREGRYVVYQTVTASYTLEGAVLENVDNIKYLGVTITNDLKWNTHISNMCTKANRTLGFFRRTLLSCQMIAYLSSPLL